jgi:hypothetical protein
MGKKEFKEPLIILASAIFKGHRVYFLEMNAQHFSGGGLYLDQKITPLLKELVLIVLKNPLSLG